MENATIHLQWDDGDVIGVWLELPGIDWSKEPCSYLDACAEHVQAELTRAGIVAPRLRPWPMAGEPATLILFD